jgi:hypothetical protein
MNPPLPEVAALLPDVPRWVEVRSMLLHGHARLVGSLTTSPPTFIAVYADGDQAAVVGRAPPAAILDVASTVSEILVSRDDTAWVKDVLPAWGVEPAILYRRDAALALPVVASSDVRFLAEGEVARLRDLSDELREELHVAERLPVPIAAALDEGRPASFCYAGSITETLWDVSIDTIETCQRRGLATKVVSFLIGYYAARGQQPVWGAYPSNHASVALAARLGFLEMDTLSVFSQSKK